MLPAPSGQPRTTVDASLYPVLGSGPDQLRTGSGSSPSALVPVLVIIGAGVVAHLLAEAVGYRTAALEATTSEQDRRARTANPLTTTGILRLTLCEAVAFVALAAAFLVGA